MFFFNEFPFFHHEWSEILLLCTRIIHGDKEACPSKPLSAREIENAVIEKIKELSQNRSQLEETLKNANLIAQEELKPLKERRALLEKSSPKNNTSSYNYS